MQVSAGVRNYYTDILCHEFNPSQTVAKLAIGTNFGDLYVIGDEDVHCLSSHFEFTPTCLWESEMPNDEPVVNLCWDNISNEKDRLIVLSNRGIYNFERGGTPQRIFEPLAHEIDFMDFALLHQLNALCLVSDDTKTRIIDRETQQVKLELNDHSGIVQVCKATDEYVATGSMHGSVHLYDAQFRTNKKISSFGDESNCVNNLVLSESSVWLAVSGTESSDTPSVYNIRSRKQILTPQPDAATSRLKCSDVERISALRFDSKDGLYWGGASGSLYKSEDYLSSYTELKATYGLAQIPQILSIATREGDSTGGTLVTVAGATNSILFSSRGFYWDSMIHLQRKKTKRVFNS